MMHEDPIRMPLTPLQHLVAALREPACYPHAAAEVAVHETHISVVLLAGDHAYKLKKPLDLGFLDFSTLEKRRSACEAELALNRRTAPSLYLDVVPIGGTPDAPRIGALPAIEYAVHMRRFPQEALLDRIAVRDCLDAPSLDALARDLAAFHARCDIAAEDTPWATPEAVLEPAAQNFTQLAPLIESAHDREMLDALRDWTRAEHARIAPAITARRGAGRVRECHGDLHLGNLVMLDGRATPFDCIEFNPRLRWIDVASEIAFLVMDLIDHGARAAAHRLLDGYLAATGDYDGLAVLPFYLVYRAMVRAKIACMRAHQPGLDLHGRTRADAQYHGYLRLARQLTAPHRPVLALMHGLSGSGKSSAALALVERTGAVRVRADVERKRLHGLAWDAASGAALDAGLYSHEATVRTYARLEALAGVILDAGFSAIIDAASLRRAERDAFGKVAAAHGVPFVVISCDADVPTLRARIEARRAAGGDASEATLAVLDRQLATQERLTDDERPRTLRLDTTLDEAAFASALDAVARKLRA
jgi:aminoglycoside phosphotransferase family enzyme/predicted kinase